MSALLVDIPGKSFGAHQVLGPIRLEVSPGQIVALLGPSGSGKSTLLSMVAGLDRDHGGRIETAGRLGMVFQEPRLFPWRTLAENIALIPGAGDLALARARLAAVGLAGAADHYPQKVSLGMQRRASLARALAIRPGLILMDEPLVSLDADTATDMRALIARTLADEGAAALIATHDRREALHLADRIVMLGGTPTGIVDDRLSPLGREDRRDAARVEALHRDWYEPRGTARD